MRIRIWHKMGTLDLKIFLSISLGIHLLFLSTAFLLFSDMKIDRPPILDVEVSLFPLMGEERQVKTQTEVEQKQAQLKAQIKKEEKKALLSLLPIEVDVKNSPMPDSPPLPFEGEISETKEENEKELEKEEKVATLEEVKKVEKIEKLEKEPMVQTKAISLNPGVVLTFRRGEPSEYPDHPLPVPSPSEELNAVAKEPFPFEEKMVFTQPMYAESPKPLYPPEARRRGYQGEVVLKVEVLSSGWVGQVEVKTSSGHEILDRCALAAVKQWRFIPARKGEDAIPFWVNIPIKFQLQ